MMGTWVEFTTQREGDQTKRRRYVRLVEGRHAIVFDEHSFAEVHKRHVLNGTNSHTSQVKIETRELEISRTQAPLLPKNDPIHPLTGQRVVIISGPFKGLYGNIREVGVATMVVELTALLAGASSPHQSFKLHDLMIMYIAQLLYPMIY
jgi:transcription antitermination factor NusG